jgi:hypothetical protein
MKYLRGGTHTTPKYVHVLKQRIIDKNFIMKHGQITSGSEGNVHKFTNFGKTAYYSRILLYDAFICCENWKQMIEALRGLGCEAINNVNISKVKYFSSINKSTNSKKKYYCNRR